ncbi:MAG: hypothetical protein V4724_28090 [Pseudomonadota bacterium]
MKTTPQLRRSPILAGCFIGLLLTLGGCATPASHEAMVPVSFQVAKQHPKSIAVVVAGGTETSAAGKSQIGDGELKQALVKAIEQTKTFSQVVEGKSGDYILNVNIFNVVQPSFGFSFTVQMEMGWTLTRADTGATVWQESIKSEHTATTSDAFAGVTRLKLANEGAVRNNVAQGLTKLSALSL